MPDRRRWRGSVATHTAVVVPAGLLSCLVQFVSCLFVTCRCAVATRRPGLGENTHGYAIQRESEGATHRRHTAAPVYDMMMPTGPCPKPHTSLVDTRPLYTKLVRRPRCAAMPCSILHGVAVPGHDPLSSLRIFAFSAPPRQTSPSMDVDLDELVAKRTTRGRGGGRGGRGRPSRGRGAVSSGGAREQRRETR